MNPSTIIDAQILEAQQNYPFLSIESNNSFNVIFPDSPQNQFEILLTPNFPEIPPLLYLNQSKLQIPFLTYWNSNFTICQLLQHLHLYSVAKASENIYLSPPLDNLTALGYENENQKMNEVKPQKIFGSVIMAQENSDDEENLIDEASYNKLIAELKTSYKKKQISTSDYIKEFEKLRKFKVQH